MCKFLYRIFDTIMFTLLLEAVTRFIFKISCCRKFLLKFYSRITIKRFMFSRVRETKLNILNIRQGNFKSTFRFSIFERESQR